MLAGTMKEVRGEGRGRLEVVARLCALAAVWYFLFYQNLLRAYQLRLKPIEKLGPIIHGFQPYLNIRYAQYLQQNGLSALFHWYDTRAWYPIGIDVGRTIYPALPISTVASLWVLRDVLYIQVSLQEVAAYLPVVAGLCSVLFTAFLTRECTRSWPAASIAGYLMAVLPGNMTYTMGGKYDSVALLSTASTLSMYLWAKSIQNDPAIPQSPRKSLMFGCLSGAAMAFTAACWKGFGVFLLIVTLHTLILCLIGRYSRIVCCAFSAFFATTTVLSLMIPVVRLDPLTPLVLAPGAVLFLMLLGFESSGIKPSIPTGSLIVAAWVGVVAVLFEGKLGPLKDMPERLIESATEDLHPHLLIGGPSSHFYLDFLQKYWTRPPNVQFLFDHFSMSTWTITPGVVLVLSKVRNNAALFAMVYGCVVGALFLRRTSIVVLATPVVALFSGAALGIVLVEWLAYTPIFYLTSNKKKSRFGIIFHFGLLVIGNTLSSRTAMVTQQLDTVCEQFATKAAESAIVFKVGEGDEEVIIDDYRATYYWIMENTPVDSRVLAWEDYGYHLSSMSNRTTLIDSRSPISEEQRLHRATVALALVSEEAASAKIVKHLADYVVTWVNGNGEDLAKLGVIASVANEAYLFVCGADVNCKLFESPEGKGRVFNSKVKSTLLYKLGRYRSRGNEDITLSHFEHMYTSAHGKVRVFKVNKASNKSRKWARKRRNCTGYSCPGKHPPLLRKHLKGLAKSHSRR